FVVLRGFGALAGDALPAFGAALGELAAWEFGVVNELAAREGARNYIYTDREVPFHWDGAFAARAPRYIVFACDDAPPPGSGGATLFTDTPRLLRRAGDARCALWGRVQITYETEKIVHYGGRVTAPMLATHPATGEVVLRYAEPVDDINPVRLSI